MRGCSRSFSKLSGSSASFDSETEEKTEKRSRRQKEKEPRPSEKDKDGRPTSAEESANILSRLTFHWISGLLRTGYQRPLRAQDIPLINRSCSTETRAAIVNAAFKAKRNRDDKFPLFWSLYDLFKREFWVAGCFRLAADVLLVSIPYTLRYFIQFIADSYQADLADASVPSLWHGITLLAGIVAMQSLQSFFHNHFSYRIATIGSQCRAIVISALFDKSVRNLGRGNVSSAEDLRRPTDMGLKEKALSSPEESYTIGRVTSLMSVDSSRVESATAALHILWTAPIALIMSFSLLVANLGFSILSGFGLLILGFMILTRIVGMLFRQRKALDSMTDARVTLIHEVLAAIRSIKYFNWEERFARRITDLRDRETRRLQHYLLGRNFVTALSQSLPFLTAMISFITYALTSKNLSPAIVFSSTALFNTLRMPLTYLPLCIQAAFDSWAALLRIQEYLLREEMEEIPYKPRLAAAIEVRRGTFTWNSIKPDDVKESKDDDSVAYSLPMGKNPKSTFTLEDIHLFVPRGELLVVIGSVGSGKTSFLSALAGDMQKTSGSVAWGDSYAICPQQPWIQNATVRENIIFGRPFERGWYRTVLQACSLTHDLDILSHGDATIVGERGVVLSGGQKQRISLARAMYSRADVLLLDDPLSAVDANVGRYILDNAICGKMSSRTRILATHHLHMLHRCDRILWLEHGRVRALDTHDNLMAHEPEFALMVEEARGRDKMAGTYSDIAMGVDRRSTAPHRMSVADNPKQRAGPTWMYEDIDEAKDKLIQDEDQETRSVSWSVYGSFIASSGSTLLVVVCIPLLIAAQGCTIMASVWLAWWSSNRFDLPQSLYIGIYASLAIGQFIFVYLFSVTLAMCCVRSSRTMMIKALQRVLRAPVSYFDTTPLGRLLNRFSKDVEVMDYALTEALRKYLYSLFGLLAMFALIISYFYWSAIAIGVVLGILVVLAQYYRYSAREIKRHESVFRSIAFARFVEALSGVATIRVYRMNNTFSTTLCRSVDDMNSALLLTHATQRWLSLRLDFVGILLMVTMGILVLLDRQKQNPSIAGLVLSLSLGAIQVLQVVVREWADVENAMNSTERLYAYANTVSQETNITPDLTEAGPAPYNWPTRGEINFSHVRMRYRAGLPEALRGFNLRIRGGERMAIVGRTGAGKSSIINALFRLSELSRGRITIDGQNISQIRLEDLRGRLSIVPQDIALFSGTVRSNLDPFDTLSDAELWDSINAAGLQETLHLGDAVEDGGSNLSLGQKQLLALARVLVRRNRIVVCDEATAALDTETDARMQWTMRTAFRDKTVIYVAHRLRTVLGYDRICVMENGCVAELGTPLELFREKGGIFRDMCVRDGITEEQISSADKAVQDYPLRKLGQSSGDSYEQTFEQFFAQWI
ncbi:P-loop containing nucleoside triphosphate hydrolase protein [Biscogniauxia mediterranea]|nr:P-loop containing nucleoside triphosphate hydrolase protein [Biscogniauxia mediterranea]